MGTPRLRIFISSPGDVAEERVIANNLIRRLADSFADRVWIEPIFWEHEPLLATETFQKQIPPPHECEVAVCILWSRLGTRLPADITRADGTTYASGTEYEFEDAAEGFLKTGHPQLLVYRKLAEPLGSFKDTKAARERIGQQEALDEFINKWFINESDGTLKAAYHSFNTPADFQTLLEEHLRRLIEKHLPAHEHDLAPAKLAWPHGSPFRGLDVFDIEHAPIYFGRTRAIGDVLNALRASAAAPPAGRGFVLVVGVSGGGKSSLIRAGVLPMLVQPGVIEGVGLWRQAILKPSDAGNNLFKSLALALLSPTALPELAADGTTADSLADLLGQSPAAAFAVIKGALSQAAADFRRAHALADQPEARLVIVVDQLEELFTTPDISPADRTAFIAALAALARSGKVWIIATLRGDFYHRALELPDLVALQEGPGQYALPLPTPAELAQMIRLPAAAAGLHFEEDPQTKIPLDEILRDAASNNPESLPLLEFALEELYRARTATGELTYAAYQKLGGVEGALAQRAESVFTALPSDVQSTLPRILRALVSIGDGEAIARQQAPLTSVAPTSEAQALVEAFTQSRLFSADRTAKGQAVIRVTHEALLRAWPRVGQWLQQDIELLIIRSRVTAAAARWQSEGRRADLLLPEGKPLAEGKIFLAALGPEVGNTERQFIAASQRRAAGRRLLKRSAIAALFALATAACLIAAFALREKSAAAANARQASANARDAASNADKAAKGEAAAKLSEEKSRRRLAARYIDQGWALDRTGDTTDALLYFAEAAKETSDIPSERMISLSRVAMYLRLGSFWKMSAPPMEHDGAVHSAAFSPDGTRVVTASDDGTARVWDAATGQPISPPMKHDDSVVSAAFSPDGTRVVTASDDCTARVWDAATGQPISPPIKHGNLVRSAAFSPDGTRVVTASADCTARVWDAATGQPISPPIKHGNLVRSAAFSPDGTRVVTASDDHTARVWDAATGQPISPPMKHDGQVLSAAFSPDGTRVVTARWDSTVRVWDAATGQPISPPMKHDDRVNSAAFSPDGTRVVTASGDGTARVWSVAEANVPIDDLVQIAEFYAGAQIDSTGSIVPLPPVALQKGYDHLHLKYPDYFRHEGPKAATSLPAGQLDPEAR